MYFEDLSTATQVASNKRVRAIGWLSADHDFPRGPSAPEFRRRLAAYASDWSRSTKALGWPLFLGFHTCEFCQQSRCTGNFGVPAGEILYVCPEMIGHYVHEHQYLPPDDFINALLASPPPNSPEYAEAVRIFRDDPAIWPGKRGLITRILFRLRASR